MKIPNLIFLGLALGLIAAHMIYFTTWWEFIGGVFTLSGAFVWLAFLSNLLTVKTKKALQEQFEYGFLAHRFAWAIPLSLLFVYFLAVASNIGTFRFEGTANESTRLITLERSDGQAHAAVTLPPRSTVKLVRPTGFWQEPRFKIKATGLPELERKLSWGWPLEIISVPDDFLLQPAVLLRPSAKLARDASNINLRLTLFHNKNQTDLDLGFFWQSLWIGVEETVEVPTALQQYWRTELASTKAPAELLLLWMHPGTTGITQLEAGDELYAALMQSHLDGSESVFADACLRVKEASLPGDFPQVMVFRSKQDCLECCSAFAP